MMYLIATTSALKASDAHTRSTYFKATEAGGDVDDGDSDDDDGDDDDVNDDAENGRMS